MQKVKEETQFWGKENLNTSKAFKNLPVNVRQLE